MSHNPPFKSKTFTWNPSSTDDVFDFVPLRGPGGGRVVIDRFILCITGIITVATANWNGADVVRLFRNIRIEQRDNKARWNLSGMQSRLASIMFNGIVNHHEHATIAVAVGAAVDFRLVIPMTKPFIRRGKDFALPADIFSKITVDTNSLAGAATGTTVLSAQTLTYYVLAEWHEEFSVEFKAEDVIKSSNFSSNTQASLNLSGAVHDLFLLKEDSTAGGGTSLSAITDARIEDLGTPTLTRQDLVHSYRAKRGYGASGPTTPGTERFLEPVLSGFVLPLIVSDNETSLWDGRVLPTMKIDVGTGLAGLAAVTREITEKSQANFNAQRARFGIAENAVRMKTDGKSRRGFGDGWTKRELMVGVWSAPLNKVA